MTNFTAATAKITALFETEVNVRTVKHSAETVDQIAHSIIAVGLIQPLVVVARTGKKKGFDVIAGEGRRKAIARAIELKPELAQVEWPIRICESAEQATQISLIENEQRADMTMPDRFKAFARIRAERPNATLDEIGAIFGYDAPRTARILRCANLAPAIMEAWVEGRLDDSQALAYAATDDCALQMQVYESIAKHSAAHVIKRALDVGNSDLTPKLRFVGVEAYRAAGGGFTADLLEPDPCVGIIHDPAILNELVAAKIDAEKDAFVLNLVRNGVRVQEGSSTALLHFQWADRAPQIKEYGSERADYELCIRDPKRGPVPAEFADRYIEIEARLAELTEGEPSEGDEDEIEALSEEREQIEAKAPIQLPDNDGLVVGVAKIGRDGELDIGLWYANRDAAGIATRKGSKSVSAIKDLSPAEVERARFGIAKDAMQGMMLLRREMVREELFHSAISGSPLALDFVLFTQARTLLHGTTGYMRTHYIGAATGTADLSDDFADVPSKQREWIAQRPEHQRWQEKVKAMSGEPWAAERDPIIGFELFCAEGEELRNRCAALIAGHTLRASTSHYSDGRTPRMVQALANRIEAEPGFGRWRDAVDLDTAFFESFSHKARLALLERMGLGERTKGMKSSETAAFCARVVNCDDADAELLGLQQDDLAEAVNWLPEFLETHSVEPLPAREEAPADDSDPEDELDEDEEEFDREAANDDGEIEEAMAAE